MQLGASLILCMLAATQCNVLVMMGKSDHLKLILLHILCSHCRSHNRGTSGRHCKQCHNVCTCDIVLATPKRYVYIGR